MRRSLATFSSIVVLAVATRAVADTKPSIDARGFRPSPDPNATLFLEPTSVPGSGNFNAATWFSWAYRPLTLRRDGEDAGALIRQQLSVDAAVNVGIGKRASLGLVLPAVIEQSGDSNQDTAAVLGTSSIAPRAVGDLALVGKGVLVPMKELGGFGLAAVARVTLPTGDPSSGLGEGAPTTELRALAEYKLVAISVIGTAGFRLRTEDRTLGSKTFGDEIPWGIGAFLRPQMFGWDDKGRWTWGVEAHGWVPSGPSAPFTDAALSPVFAGVTARYVVRDVGFLGGVESGFTHAAGAAPLRIVVAATWAPREHDQDHDGVPDDVDECVGLAEDRDGFQDEDGCPEMDNDDDGVLDPDDKCPMQPEDQDDFEDEDGCPDPDNDKDGIPDELDACPNEAGPASPDPKANGCPTRDQDADQDQVKGAADKCPTQPEDVDGFEDEDGCPDPDNDGDGIADVDDACPNQKGERTSNPKTNGCPNTDSDGDGIPNDQDKCPTEAETYNGFQDDDGCPEPASKRHPPLVSVVEKKGVKTLALQGRVELAKDQPSVAPNGVATLRAIAQVLNAHPSWSVVVAVRPSPKGGDDLARARASAIAEEIRKATRRAESATVAAWKKGEMAPAAEVTGISIALVAPEGK